MASGSRWASHWTLDPEINFLNHGSFGACPRAVLEVQSRWRARLEREPVRFMARELEGLLDTARASLADFVGCDAQDLVFVQNATMGVNSVLRAFPFEPGDELLVTDHAYAACRNALDFVATERGARVVVAHVPFPGVTSDVVVERVLAAITERTRVLLLDHITSPTGLVFPVQRIVPEAERRGVHTLVDGAHAPGQVHVDIRALAPSFYTANCHKWLCAPKGAAFLYVRRDLQAIIRPLIVSHAATSKRTDRSRYLQEFDWTGTGDPTAWLTVPDAITTMGGLLPGGWDAVRAHNRALALEARRILCDALQVAPPAPDDMVGSLAAIPLPDARGAVAASPLDTEPLQAALFEQHRIEVPVWPWPVAPKRHVRIAAQLYNERAQYERLAAALVTELRST